MTGTTFKTLLAMRLGSTLPETLTYIQTTKNSSSDNMRKIFQRIEKNNYLPSGTAGHGFSGYFQTNMNKPASIGQPVLGIVQAIAQNFSVSTAQADITASMGADANFLDPKRDWKNGIWGLPTHTKANGERYSSRDYIKDTIDKKFALTLSVNSLATRVLFENTTSCGGKPRATGVEFLQGKSLYKADARYVQGSKGTLKTAIARKEVIISGGAFNTPQILSESKALQVTDTRDTLTPYLLLQCYPASVQKPNSTSSKSPFSSTHPAWAKTCRTTKKCPSSGKSLAKPPAASPNPSS